MATALRSVEADYLARTMKDSMILKSLSIDHRLSFGNAQTHSSLSQYEYKR